MIYSLHRLAVPSNSELSVPQLRFMLKEVERIIRKDITADDWDAL